MKKLYLLPLIVIEGRDGLKQSYIGFCVSFFEDVNCLERCLDSVLENKELRQYSKVLCLDGAYKGYPIDHYLSEDGSRELVQEYMQKYPGHIELHDALDKNGKPMMERFKRQRYVDIAAKQAIPWICITDSDEYVDVKRVEKLIKELKHIEEEWHDTNIENPLPVQRVGNVCQVRCIDLDDSGIPAHTMLRPRLWYRPEDMHYTTKHYWFARKEDIPDPTKTENYRQDNLAIIGNSKYKSLSINNLVIWHSRENRTEDREMRRRYYEFERLPRLEGSAKLGIFDKENIKK